MSDGGSPSDGEGYPDPIRADAAGSVRQWLASIERALTSGGDADAARRALVELTDYLRPVLDGTGRASGVLIEVYPIGRPGLVRYEVRSVGPVEITSDEAARIITGGGGVLATGRQALQGAVRSVPRWRGRS